MDSASPPAQILLHGSVSVSLVSVVLRATASAQLVQTTVQDMVSALDQHASATPGSWVATAPKLFPSLDVQTAAPGTVGVAR